MIVDADDPPGEGDWCPALVKGCRLFAPPEIVIEIWRKEWGNETQFTRFGAMHPATNLTGLWWRVAE